MLFYGDGIKVNKNETAKYCGMAADNWNYDAIVSYGLLLAKSEENKIDEKKKAI